MILSHEVEYMKKGQTFVEDYSGDKYIKNMNEDMERFYGVLEVVNVSYSMQADTYGKNFALVLYKKL